MLQLPTNVVGMLHVDPYFDFDSFVLALSQMEMKYRDVGMYGKFQPEVLMIAELNWGVFGWN